MEGDICLPVVVGHELLPAGAKSIRQRSDHGYVTNSASPSARAVA
ncbi:hypothetical protein QA942_27320 [Streptomyces sp. B21-106]